MEKTNTECPEGSNFYTIRNNEQFNVLLPETDDLENLPDVHIHPGCSYKIEVIANPRMKHMLNIPHVRTEKMIRFDYLLYILLVREMLKSYRFCIQFQNA